MALVARIIRTCRSDPARSDHARRHYAHWTCIRRAAYYGTLEMAGIAFHFNSTLVRLVVAAMLAPLFALRPSGVEAVLFHDHGPEGRHVHLVGSADSRPSDDSHAAWHENEHQSTRESPLNGFADRSHDENCDPLFFVLGESHAVRSVGTNRSIADVATVDAHSIGPIVPVDDAATTRATTAARASAAPLPRADCSIARILFAGHSLLI